MVTPNHCTDGKQAGDGDSTLGRAVAKDENVVGGMREEVGCVPLG